MVSYNGKARVAVSSHSYKLIVREKEDKPYGIGILLEHKHKAHGVDWADVRPVVLASTVSVAEIGAVASLDLHPELGSASLVENVESWDFGTGRSNFEGSCR